MSNEIESGSRFVVDLGDVKLPSVVERQIEAEFQAIVLREVAENIAGRDRNRPAVSSIWDQFGDQTRGLWPGWPDNPPPIFLGGGRSPDLVPEDHTIIMKAIMDHPLQVVRYLPEGYKTKDGGRPTGTEALQAALRVEQISEYVKDKIRKVLAIMPKIEQAQADLPESTKRAVDALRQQLSNKTLEEKRSVFRDAGFRRRYREVPGLNEGMEIAAQILEDGQDSIYSSDHSFYRLLQEGRGSSSSTARELTGGDIADADGIGAAAGGAVGSIAGGVGAGPGAVAGGAGASAGMAIVAVISWIFW